MQQRNFILLKVSGSLHFAEDCCLSSTAILDEVLSNQLPATPHAPAGIPNNDITAHS